MNLEGVDAAAPTTVSCPGPCHMHTSPTVSIGPLMLVARPYYIRFIWTTCNTQAPSNERGLKYDIVMAVNRPF